MENTIQENNIHDSRFNDLTGSGEEVAPSLDIPTEAIIDFSQLQKIGHGGSNDVYVDNKNPSYVIRVNRDFLKKAQGFEHSKMSHEQRKAAEQYIEEENIKNSQLYESFGENHCLREKVMVRRIIIEDSGVLHNFECAISIQEISDVFKNQKRISLDTAYIEQEASVKQEQEAYKRMNEALLGEGEFNENDFLKFYPQTKTIFELVEQDEKFKNCVSEFLQKFDEYFRLSGRFIDLVGKDNVVFFKEEGIWTYKLGSVIKNENIQATEQIMIALESNVEILNRDQALSRQLMNQLAVIRLLNALGLKVRNRKIDVIKLTEQQFENISKVKFV